MNTQGVSRRDLFKIGGLAAAGIMGGGLLASCSPTAAASAEHTTSIPENWDEETDVLIVGSGYAGVAAAYAAGVDNGASVKIIEKMPVAGGNSSIAGGDMAVCGSSGQKALGIEDSVDLYVSDMLAAGLNLNDEEKCRTIAEHSNETFEWTINLGVPWLKDETTGDYKPIPYGGHSVYRTMRPEGDVGYTILKAFYDKLEGSGIKVETKVIMDHLVLDDSGRVIGAQIREGYTFGSEDSGKTKNVKVNKGVVLASGGFAQSTDFRIAQDPRLDDKFDSTNHQGATAEIIKESQRIGAMAVHLDWIQCGPWCSPDETGYGAAPHWTDAMFSYAPSIAPTTGRRIVCELIDRKQYCDAIMGYGQPLVQVVSDKNVQDWHRPYLEKAFEAGITETFDTLDEIADYYDMPVDAFKDEMERYNTFVANRVDEDFAKVIPEAAKLNDEPPYYCTRLWPKLHHTMGGLKTNLDCQVLDLDLNPIPGLYAAGEITGGVHGACRLGSCATADGLINGKIAGEKVAAETA